MRHLEVHILSSVEELDDAYTAGLIDKWDHLFFGPFCDKCNQMLLLAKHEKLFIVVDEQSSKVLCSMCLTEHLGAGILGT
jgi:RNase P subunit RPR2